MFDFPVSPTVSNMEGSWKDIGRHFNNGQYVCFGVFVIQ